MPDIAMCQENDCPKKDSCYRFRAIPENIQCYMQPESFDETGCPDYLSILPGHKINKITNHLT